MLPSRLLRAWRRTSYRVGDAEARVGRRSRAMDRALHALGVRQGVLIGAGNPLGRRLAEKHNLRRHRALLERVRRLSWCEGEGVGRGWRERHLLLGCTPTRGVMLARLFRQGGIVVVRVRQPAMLVLIRRKREEHLPL